MKFISRFRSYIPRFILNKFKELKRKKFNEKLSLAEKSGDLLSLGLLEAQLQSMGIVSGDSLLVHASLRQIGFVQDGPATVICALQNVVGDQGNLLMPSSPVSALQFDYASSSPLFDVNETPSAMGAISENFRRLPNVKRSLHPTESVCALGPQAAFLTQGHFGQLTPYNSNSPFYRLCELKGKILYVGVTLDNAGTNLHTLEDAVDFPYPIYHQDVFELKVKDENNVLHLVKTKVHNPVYSKKRKCDELIPLFLENKACQWVKLGEANCLLFDADLMFKTMIQAFELNGTTMYTPNGSLN